MISQFQQCPSPPSPPGEIFVKKGQMPHGGDFVYALLKTKGRQIPQSKVMPVRWDYKCEQIAWVGLGPGGGGGGGGPG